MSERRQLALMLAGVVALALVGVGGATLFPEPCETLETQAQLDVAFTDAMDALPLDTGDAEALEGVGDDLGIGPWRGAVALPEGTEVGASEFGFFVVTEDAFTVLRPGIGVVSSARGRTGLDAVPTGTNLLLRADDGEVAIVDAEYELARCGSLPPGGEVLAVDRGFAVVVDGAEVVVVALSGGEVWRAPMSSGAHIAERTVVLGRQDLLELRDLRSGEVLQRDSVDAVGDVPWVWAGPGQLLVRDGLSLRPARLSASAIDLGDPVPLPDVPVLDAVRTPAGVVALGAPGEQRTLVATDRLETPVELPGPVRAQALHASDDGHVGIVVVVDDTSALLVYGPDQPG